MILSPQINQNLNTALFVMASLSPTTKDSIELELYRQNADSDASDLAFVTDDALGNTIKDLESIGLNIEFDYAELLQDMGKLFEFIYLVSFLLPNGLYERIETDSKLRLMLSDALTGSLGDNETLIHTYLSELGGLYGHPALYDSLTEIVDHYYPLVSQTDVFTDYIQNLMDLYHEKLGIDFHEQEHTKYIEVTRHIISRLSDAVNLFEDEDYYPDLVHLQSQFINDLFSPMNFVDYNYLLTTHIKDLPDDLKRSFLHKYYLYRCSTPGFYQYYSVRKKTETYTEHVFVHCFSYAFAPELTRYQTEDKQKSLLDNYKALVHAAHLDQNLKAVNEKILGLISEEGSKA